MLSLSSRTVILTPATELKGTLQIGSWVKVHAFKAADGSFTAREVEPTLSGLGASNSSSIDDSSLRTVEPGDDHGGGRLEHGDNRGGHGSDN